MKQLIHTIKTPIQASVIIPGSKSITNRALLLAALAEGVSEILDMLISDDTLAFVEALHELGIAVQLDEEARSCIVAGCGGHFPKREASIWCNDAGTVSRFLLAACAASSGAYQFDATDQLRSRPIAPLLRALAAQGVKFIPENAEQMPLTMIGKEGLPGGELEIPGEETSQFISALLMVAPFAKSTMTLITQDIVSRPYVEMTCAMMADFGVMVRRMHNARFSVPPQQRYTARDYVVEPDMSTASYFFAAAAVTGGEVRIQPIDRSHCKQGDVAFLTVLEKMGCIVTETESVLKVKGPQVLQGVNVDMRDFSDTFMTLAALAPFAATPTTITNISHTRHQESNRITTMRRELEKLQVKVEEGPDWIKIYPSEPIKGVIDSHQDHRIAMAFSIIGLRVDGIEIENAECVAKTCPEFFTLWHALGE
jgi:3-phosphoshikimate 1-carboxyvinyltransferase